MKKEFVYDAFVFHQRADGQGPKLALFYAPASQVSAWSDVDRLTPENRQGPQREPKPSRIDSIKQFFVEEPQNIIPTAIVVGLRGATYDAAQKKLTISIKNKTSKPGLIIDGQHRLRGLESFEANTLAPIVAILEASDLEMAFQFLVINNKSARVSPDHLRALSLNYSAEELQNRLKTARFSIDANLGSVGVLDEVSNSPFKGKVAWPNNHAKDRIIPPAAIETMAAEVKALGGYQEGAELDIVNAFLIAMWSVIKDEWPSVFVFDGNSKLLSKVGLICMTEFFCKTLKTWGRNPMLRSQVDPGDPEKVRVLTKMILDTLDPQFFEIEWASTSYDTRAGRDMILADLEQLSTNVADDEVWHHKLRVIDRKDLQNMRTGAKLKEAATKIKKKISARKKKDS